MDRNFGFGSYFGQTVFDRLQPLSQVRHFENTVEPVDHQKQLEPSQAQRRLKKVL